jgi:hypothetical protein
MVVVLLAVSTAALTTTAFRVMMPSPRNYLFGGVLLLYALVRFSRLMRQINRDKHTDR